MLNRLDEADRVLLVCTRTYYRRFRGHEEPGHGKGVDWEGAIITQGIYDTRSATTRFIPVLFDPADEPYIPEPVRGQSRYVLTSEKSYQDLLDVLLDQAGVEPSPVGEPNRRPRLRAEPLTFACVGDSKPSEPHPDEKRAHEPVANPFLGDSTELIGRDDALRRIFEKLRAGNHCSVVGPPGSGKSSILRVFRQQVPEMLGWPEPEIGWISFRTIQTLNELKEAIVSPLGGQRAADWRGLMRTKPLRLLALDDLGGMDPGARGLTMRRWLRGLDDGFGTKLLPVSNERLDVLFRKDDPTRDSPLAGIDPIPVGLDPLSPRDCRRLADSRLAGTGLRADDYADLCREAQQPKALLARCAARFEDLRRSAPGVRP